MPLTTPQDMAGLPACALRVGFDELGLPIAVQLTGPPWAEALVLVDDLRATQEEYRTFVEQLPLATYADRLDAPA